MEKSGPSASWTTTCACSVSRHLQQRKFPGQQPGVLRADPSPGCQLHAPQSAVSGSRSSKFHPHNFFSCSFGHFVVFKSSLQSYSINSTSLSLFELLFHVGVDQEVKPKINAFLDKIKESKFKNKSERARVVSAKKNELVTTATRKIQAEFEGPLGEGLRCFRREPQKGGKTYLLVLILM